MGVTTRDIAYITALTRGGNVSLERVLQIGRQSLFVDGPQMVAGSGEGGRSMDLGAATALVEDSGGFAETWFEDLGASSVESVDVSEYEGSTHVHDMNDPLPAHLRRDYSFVFDGGSIEHIFNVPTALGNAMAAVRTGGHLLTVTTCNNAVGHGFYQFSPEFFFRALTPENGFEVRSVVVKPLHRWGSWMLARDPAHVGQRVELTNAWPTLIYALAQRVNDNDAFGAWPQQSDYQTEWATGERLRVQRFADRLPAPGRRAVKVATAFAGTTSDPSHFRKVAVGEIPT